MYGVKLAVAPWHCMPSPYVFVIYGPCKTCIAWLVTEPEELATGFAVAETPPTSVAYTGTHVESAVIAVSLRIYWLIL